MARILLIGSCGKWRAAAQKNEVDDRLTMPRGSEIPTFSAVIFYARYSGFSDWHQSNSEPETAVGFSTGTSLHRLCTGQSGPFGSAEGFRKLITQFQDTSKSRLLMSVRGTFLNSCESA